jgi:small subunit ribosomal protein S1
VTQYAKKGRDIVVSRKGTLEQVAEQQRGELLAKIEPDTVCEGVVRRVLNWGVFVTLPEHGDVEGVIHMSEASHDRGAKLTELFRSGQPLSVKVLRIDDKGKLWLSRRAVEKNPWDDVAKKYPVGSRHRGVVVRLAEFGAFIQLEPGVDGLCHISDLSFQSVEHPSEAVQIGQDLEVVVANLDAHAHKIGLHPAAPADEQGEVRPRLQAHQTVQVVVMQIKEGGLAVRVVGLTGRAQRGFIPAGLTGTPRGTELRKVFPVGKRIEVKVVEVDPRKGESKLSIRALKEDAEREAYRQYRRQLQKEASFGTLGDLLKKS